MSTKPAIGSQFTEHLMPNKARNDFTVNLNGFRLAMPRYYKNKVFSIMQKQKHAKEMVEFSDKKFKDYLELCKQKGIAQPFVYMEKERESAILLDEKKLKLRKL